MNPGGLRGIITRVHGREVFAYALHDGERSAEFSAREFFQPGESVHASCIEREGRLFAEKIERIPDVYPGIEKKVQEGAEISPIAPFDATIDGMDADFIAIARKIRAAQQLNRAISVKFHGDADGISSALIFRKFLRADYSQQNSAIYSVADATRDMERMGQRFRPLIILLDFGSGEDSEEGLRLAKAGGLEILSVDHHPPHPDSVSTFALWANPWKAGEGGDFDGSKYPAGFLCAKIAGALGHGSEGLERIACAGDKSAIIPISDSEREKALVLDFVATYAGFGNGIAFYSEALAKPELFNSLLTQANAKLDEADRLLRAELKARSSPKADIYWFNLDNVGVRKEFPNKGKIAGRVFELVGKGKPMVAIGYGKKTVILRISDEAVANGIRANGIIARMKEKFSDFVENGGGHTRAAALRIKEGFENAAVEEIIKSISSQ